MVGATSVFAANEPGTPGDGKSPRPNILLIIGDDIGIDVTTDMYPGLIDSLIKQYGPSGHNHPNYQMIKGRPASTPTLNRLATGGHEVHPGLGKSVLLSHTHIDSHRALCRQDGSTGLHELAVPKPSLLRPGPEGKGRLQHRGVRQVAHGGPGSYTPA